MPDRPLPPLRVVVDALGALVAAGEIAPLTPWQIELIAFTFSTPEHPAPTRRPVAVRPNADRRPGRYGLDELTHTV